VSGGQPIEGLDERIGTREQARKYTFRHLAEPPIPLNIPHCFDYDFAIAGGGPAGAAAAIALASRGRSVVVLESERFPRFHIGESLIATVNECFDALGVAERIRGEGFPRKWGATLSTHDGAAGREVDFDASDEVAQPQTYQVERARFDQILLERASEAGADVRQATRVRSCEIAPGGVTLTTEADGTIASLRVRAVVDASGRAGLLARQLGLRRPEPALDNVAIYAHYSGVPRQTERRAGDIRIVARSDAGWFWLIPIDQRLTSVGVVLPRALYKRLERGSPERLLLDAVAETPAVAALMRDAEREWPVRVEKDFTYGASAYAGDRWLLAGDAGSFLDPVFSTGVAIALESGLEAAAALDRAASRDRFAAAEFRDFERRQRRRFDLFRRFVLAFYTPWFRDLFFQPAAPAALFRAVVTVLAGVWRPRLRTRLQLELFFLAVALQRRFELVPRLVPRGGEAAAHASRPAVSAPK